MSYRTIWERIQDHQIEVFTIMSKRHAEIEKARKLKEEEEKK